MKKLLRRFLGNVTGVTAVEYGLITALISVGILSATVIIGDEISGSFETVSTELSANIEGE